MQKLGTLAAIALAACWICAVSFAGEDAAGTASGKKSAKMNLSSPKQACQSIVQAAKQDNFKAIETASLNINIVEPTTQMAGEAGQDSSSSSTQGAASSESGSSTQGSAQSQGSSNLEGAFHNMYSKEKERLADLKCGQATIAADHAIVLSSSKGEQRLIPFVKQGNEWRFDTRTYMSFYRDSMKESGIQMKSSG